MTAADEATRWVFEHWGDRFAAERLIMLFMAQHCERNGDGWVATPKNMDIVEWTGVSPRHLRVCLGTLVADGLLKKEHRPTGADSRWVYHFGSS